MAKRSKKKKKEAIDSYKGNLEKAVFDLFNDSKYWEIREALGSNKRFLEDIKKAAVVRANEMLQQTNMGVRKRRSVKDFLAFFESLPAQITAEVEFFGCGLLRNIYTSGDDLYELSSIELTRRHKIKIFGWDFYHTFDSSSWDWSGVCFSKNDEKRREQNRLLNEYLFGYVSRPDYISCGGLTREQIQDAIACYEIEHGGGFDEFVFYRRSKGGQLYLRDCYYGDEDEYFKDLEPLDRDEAFEQILKSSWTVYEEHEHRDSFY